MESPSIDSGVNKAPYTLTVHFPNHDMLQFILLWFYGYALVFWGGNCEDNAPYNAFYSPVQTYNVNLIS